jgi:hypothetical protein
MNVTRDQELWALALNVERQYGGDAPRHIAEMIKNAALEGDKVGIDLWNAIADKYDQLAPRARQ